MSNTQEKPILLILEKYPYYKKYFLEVLSSIAEVHTTETLKEGLLSIIEYFNRRTILIFDDTSILQIDRQQLCTLIKENSKNDMSNSIIFFGFLAKKELKTLIFKYCVNDNTNNL